MEESENLDRDLRLQLVKWGAGSAAWYCWFFTNLSTGPPKNLTGANCSKHPLEPIRLTEIRFYISNPPIGPIGKMGRPNIL